MLNGSELTGSVRKAKSGILTKTRQELRDDLRGPELKLRIKGNSLRLRLLRPELDQLTRTGRVAETVRFAAQPEASLTYALERSAEAGDIEVRYRTGEVTVVLPESEAAQWAESDKVGLYGRVDLGNLGDGAALQVAVEKDFACLDRADEKNADAFPNPRAADGCQP